MNAVSIAVKPAPYMPKNKVRFVTATSLFDGHDATVNIMRRILQASGAEVIHLGHNRSVQEIVNAALQEDVQGVAITSYQGGHLEFFKYMIDLLRQNGGENIKVFGGGGGVIVPAEIRELLAYGVTRLYSPEDGAKMGLQGMIDDVIRTSDYDPSALAPAEGEALDALRSGNRRQLARVITAVENRAYPMKIRQAVLQAAAGIKTPVLGITGTGGAGKSSLTDELILRLRIDQGDRVRVAVISIDPSRKRTGGALLGDRIRMNAIESDKIFMRSLATRDTGTELSAALPEVLACCKLSGFDLIVVETSGIGQGESAIVPLVDTSLYIMTPEFGAASQLEKIDMLDFADFVAINKFDRKGAEDALRDVRKQYQRNRSQFQAAPDTMPVFGTMASRFNDDGVTALYQALAPRLQEHGLKLKARHAACRESQSVLARPRHRAARARALSGRDRADGARFPPAGRRSGAHRARAPVLENREEAIREFRQAGRRLRRADRGQERRTDRGRRQAARTMAEDPQRTGLLPVHRGVFPFKREGEDPTRMFAGEGDAFRTNRRFKLLSRATTRPGCRRRSTR
jgi:methylmalonyl-CoA mutase